MKVRLDGGERCPKCKWPPIGSCLWDFTERDCRNYLRQNQLSCQGQRQEWSLREKQISIWLLLSGNVPQDLVSQLRTFTTLQKMFPVYACLRGWLVFYVQRLAVLPAKGRPSLIDISLNMWLIRFFLLQNESLLPTSANLYLEKHQWGKRALFPYLSLKDLYRAQQSF